jgi:hypothetical protein
MGKPGTKPGELVNVYFDYAEYRYVRGHVDRDVAVKACTHFGHDEEYDAAAEHCWARWTPDGTGEYSMIFNECERGRGAFAVTKLTITAAREHREKVRAQIKAMHSRWANWFGKEE